jgi:hypothetical protein
VPISAPQDGSFELTDLVLQEERMSKKMSIAVALEYLLSPEKALRQEALFYLDGSKARVQTALVRALDDPYDQYRSDAVCILGRAEARFDLLVARLQSDASACVRYWCLRPIWPENARAPEAYLIALRDTDERVLTEACISSGLPYILHSAR